MRMIKPRIFLMWHDILYNLTSKFTINSEILIHKMYKEVKHVKQNLPCIFYFSDSFSSLDAIMQHALHRPTCRHETLTCF